MSAKRSSSTSLNLTYDSNQDKSYFNPSFLESINEADIESLKVFMDMVLNGF